jgi:hypothetical protein
LIVLFVSALAVWLGFAAAAPPRAVPADAPAAAFSAERAQRHLYAITRAPHPVGTAEHAAVRGYLVNELEALGLETQVQATIGYNRLGGVPRVATVYNVLARKPGTDATGAVLLLAHYDGVPHSYGAGDDGAGVAAIMETLRALGEGPSLRNDVIVLFSDAEEVGLLGAQAFVDEHPWMADVGLVLNFEGRGVTGPVQLFQTSVGNDRLIREVAAAAPHPVASSLSYEVYQRMPNDTDLTVFLRAERPVPGLNFAFVGGHTHYHTPLDRYEELNPRSLQHHGSYALALTRHFGALDLRELRGASDRVFFSVPLLGLVHYPYAYVLPLTLLLAAWLAALVVVGLRRGRLRWKGIGAGAAFAGSALLLVPGLTFLGWTAAMALHPEYAWILQRDTYNSVFYLAGFSAVGVALAVALFLGFRRRASAAELAVVPLLLGVLLALGLALTMPGGSYLFAWPVAGGLAALSLTLLGEARLTAVRALALALLGVPALVVLPPMMRFLQEALTMGMVAGSVALLVVLLGLLLPQLDAVGRLWRWTMPLVLAAGLGAFMAATLTAGAAEQRPRPNSVLYLLDADAQAASWVSYDHEPDAFTRQFLGDAPARGPLDAYRLTSAFVPRVLHAPAPVLDLAPPSVEVLAEEAVPAGRRLRLRIVGAQRSERVALLLEQPGVAIADVELEGRSLAGHRVDWRGTVLLYFAPPADGFEIAFTVASPEPVAFRIVDTVHALPTVPGTAFRPRAPEMMSKPFVPTDATIVQRVVRL